ncbi:MAG: hypothetical protein IPK80_31770 [Nannocystis sp.]|nr:hypothetical protein [Nannocystis sp.]
MHLNHALTITLCLVAPLPTSHALAAPPPPPSSTSAAPVRPPSPRDLPTAMPRQGIDAALAQLPGPSVEEVHEAAIKRAAIAPEAARRWLKRARAAAALPTLQTEFDHSSDQGWKLAQEAGTADEFAQDLGAGRHYRVRATWSLDRLIFSPEEVRAARAMLDAGIAREQLLIRVTQLYFERAQILIERDLEPPESAAEALAQELRLRELEAILSGLTGLRFRP